MITTISLVLIGLTIYSAFGDFKEDKSLIKEVYFKNFVDYLTSFLLMLFIFSIGGFLFYIGLPEFLKFSWINLISSDESSINLYMKPFESNFIPLIILYWIIFVLMLPYLAKSEEVTFRGEKITLKDRIKSSIFFGLIHMVVGVPLFAALILSILGFIFSIFYVHFYGKYKSHHYAIDRVTSIHTKYNFFIITLLFIFVLYKG